MNHVTVVEKYRKTKSTPCGIIEGVLNVISGSSMFQLWFEGL